MTEKFLEGDSEEQKPFPPADERHRYAGMTEWKKALGKKRKPLLDPSQLQALNRVHGGELARLWRGGVVEKMMRGIPDVTEKLRERERQEIATEVGRYISVLETQIRENKGLVAELEGAVAKGTVKAEEADEVESFIGELKRDIAGYEEQIKEFRVQLEQLGIGGKSEK